MSEKPSIAGSTVGGKIFIYRFDKTEDDASSLNWLNFNKRIDYITTCFLEDNDNRECLIIASKNTISAYGIFFPKEKILSQIAIFSTLTSLTG